MGTISNPAERMRRYRERRRVGAVSVRLEVMPDTVQQLVADGWLPKERAAESKAVSDALCELLEQWAVEKNE